MKETLQFMGYAKSIDEEKFMMERENQLSTESIQNQKTEEYLKNRNYFIDQRDKFNKASIWIYCFSGLFPSNVSTVTTLHSFQSIYDEQWQQIMDRRQRLIQEKNKKFKEIIEANEIYANNAHMERELIRKKKNSRLHYGHELRAQFNYEKLEKVLVTSSQFKN